MNDPSTFRDRWRMGVEARALVLVTAVLIVFGLATLYSASAFVAVFNRQPATYYLTRQALGVLIGIVFFAVAAKIDGEQLKRVAWPLMLGTMVLLLMTLVLGSTDAVNGSRRFLFGRSLQPTEIGKLAVVLWTSMLIVKKGDGLQRLGKGLVPFLMVIGALDLLAALQPDLSVAVLYTLLMLVLLFAGGARIKDFLAVGLISAPILSLALWLTPYARARILGFMAPGGATEGVNMQGHQSLIAVGSGGILGRGYGQGRQQFGFVPEQISDFIGSSVGEEWGLLGMLFLIGMFVLYTWLGLRIAKIARTPFQQLVALGLTFTVAITAFVHIGVVVGLLPNTGLTLPFISWGRSNLVLSCLMTGMLVNIGSSKERIYGAAATDPLDTAD